MKIISEPVIENEVLAAVEDETNSEEIVLALMLRGDCCVDHLCDC